MAIRALPLAGFIAMFLLSVCIVASAETVSAAASVSTSADSDAIAPHLNREEKVALAERAVSANIAAKQQEALLIFESGRCDVVPCICSKTDKAACVRDIYSLLFGAEGALVMSDLLAREYAAVGAYATFYEAQHAAESRPCSELRWPNLDGLFPPSEGDCDSRRSLLEPVAALSPKPGKGNAVCPSVRQCGTSCCKSPNSCADPEAVSSTDPDQTGLCCDPNQDIVENKCVDKPKGGKNGSKSRRLSL